MMANPETNRFVDLLFLLSSVELFTPSKKLNRSDYCVFYDVALIIGLGTSKSWVQFLQNCLTLLKKILTNWNSILLRESLMRHQLRFHSVNLKCVILLRVVDNSCHRSSRF